jgi:hypothetical protein
MMSVQDWLASFVFHPVDESPIIKAIAKDKDGGVGLISQCLAELPDLSAQQTLLAFIKLHRQIYGKKEPDLRRRQGWVVDFHDPIWSKMLAVSSTKAQTKLFMVVLDYLTDQQQILAVYDFLVQVKSGELTEQAQSHVALLKQWMNERPAVFPKAFRLTSEKVIQSMKQQERQQLLTTMRSVLSSNISVIRKVLIDQAQHHTPLEIDALLAVNQMVLFYHRGLFSLPRSNNTKSIDQKRNLDLAEVPRGGQHCRFIRGGG